MQKSGHVLFTEAECEEGSPLHYYVVKCELDICKICGGAEATLTTECPGREMTEVEMDYVFNDAADFINNGWVFHGGRGDVPE